ncbi:copper chaperone PCu(A)C [Egicoccus sp. AB-alg6-2]|uniref:copper chaperone PCu(A)C n=1 Tax=Egicoccus sp. AB-alg6-2 TaxID=3242692 RepID=UPI00359E046D
MPALRRATLPVLLLLVAVTVLVGCTRGEPDIAVSPAQAGAPAAGSSQVVVEIRNSGEGDDTLLGASTPAAAGVEMHLTEVTDGRASMRQQETVAVPSGDTVRFRPGGLHLMLVVPDESVVVGGTFELTLHFERSGDRTIPVEVVSLLDLAEDAFDQPAPEPGADD